MTPGAAHDLFVRRLWAVSYYVARAHVAVDEPTGVPGSLLRFPYGKLEGHPRFESWVLHQAVRWLNEEILLFLDEMYCFLTLDDAARERFGSNALGEKKKELLRCGVNTDKWHFVEALNAIRRCIVHRAGVVGNQDARREGGLVIRYFKMSADCTHPSKTVLSSIPTEVTFREGDSLEFPPHLIDDLCMSVWWFSYDVAYEVRRLINDTSPAPKLPDLMFKVAL